MEHCGVHNDCGGQHVIREERIMIESRVFEFVSVRQLLLARVERVVVGGETQREAMETSGEGFSSYLREEQLPLLMNTHLFLCREIKTSEFLDDGTAVLLNLLPFGQSLLHRLQFLLSTA